MNLKTLYTVLSKTIVVTALCFVAPCCSLIYDDADDVEYASGDFTLKVSIQTGKDINSRADHTDDAELKGTAAENHIDFESGNFKIVLFNADGTHLLDVDRSDWEVSTSEDSYYVYHVIDVNITLPDGTTKETKDRIKSEGVKVMALANWNTPSTTDDRYASIFTKAGDSHMSLSEIWSDNVNYNFSYQAGSDDASWIPNVSARRLIPMFGIGTSSPFTQSTGGTEYRTAVIVPMQRAMAKVEVINNIEPSKGAVTNVYMSAYNTSGRLIPDVAANPGWDQVGSQVETSSLPTDVTTLDKSLTFVQEGTKWVAYIPEMELDDRLTEARPHVNVVIDGNERHTVHFALYDDQSMPSIPDDSWNHILRNHIYRYIVTRGSIRTSIHLHVIPWERDDDEVWDFTDHVSVQTLTWEGYDNINEDTGEVYLSFDHSLKGNFQIMSPINGRWYVSLVPLSGAKPSAVSFVDSYGNVLEPNVGNPPYCLEYSGLIPGPVGSVIYIAPTDMGSDQESRFRLEFYVENMGNWVEVPMVKDGSVSNYTIIRKANLIQ